MTESTFEAGSVPKADQWRERIAEQESSGMSARQFCKERGFSEPCFYSWRKRLRRREPPVRFALVERGPAPREFAMEAGLELVMVSGERLRIAAGVDAATLRVVLEALRA
jgi:hypothetical protein